MKISRKTLENLSKDDLLALAREADKIQEAAKYRTLESYFETAHEDQIAFHKAGAEKRIRYFVGGNRCLIESTRLNTENGAISIADIHKPTRYVSLDQSRNEFRLSLGSAPYPKAKEILYRVVHEQGEFVGSAQHQILCFDGVYRSLEHLAADPSSLISIKDAYSLLPRETSSGSFPPMFLEGDRHLSQIHEGYEKSYSSYNRQCDQQLLLEEEIGQDGSRRLVGAPRSSQLDDPVRNDPRGSLAGLSPEHIRLDRVIDLIYNARASLPEEVQSESEFLIQALIASSGHISPDIRFRLQSFLMSLPRLKDSKFFQPTRDVARFCTSLAGTLLLPPVESKVLSIEKILKKDWVWDVEIPGDNNYLAEGSIHHNSGKSTAGVVEDIWLATGTHPYMKKWKTPCKGIVVVQDFENHSKNILEPKIMEWAPKGSIESIDRNQTGAIRKIIFKNGSTIDVCSHDQELKVFEGADYDFAHFDEPPPKKIYTAVWRGMTDRGGLMYVTATPLTSPWMYREYKKAEKGDPLRWFVFVHTQKNAKNLGEGNIELGMKRIEEFASLLDDSEKAARLRGEFAQMQGLIFQDFKEDHHFIPEFPIPAHWKIWESIDPHPQKPWAVSYIAISDNGHKILLRCNKQISGTIEQIADQILFERKQLKIRGDNRPRLVRCIIDNYASVPTWQKSNTDPTIERISVREELEGYIGPRVGGPSIEVAPKNVSQKILLFSGWLSITEEKKGHKESNFYAFDNAENRHFFQDEIENYVWDTTKDKGLKGTPKKENDDILDTIMQVALSLPRELKDEEFAPVKVMENKSWTVR